MTVYRFCILGVVLLTISLVGCMKPQIISPMSAGFSPNEYLVVEAKTKSRLGQLYEAIQETDEKGRKLPLRWRETAVCLFPQGDGNNVNQIEEIQLEQTRNALETTGTSGKLTAATFVVLNGENKSAFKFQSKSSRFSQFKIPLRYAPKGKTFMKGRLQKNPAYQFAYLSALYEGTAFVEIFNNIATRSSGNYAAFQIEGDYYTTSNTGVITSGPIIYQLLPIDLDELQTEVSSGEREFDLMRQGMTSLFPFTPLAVTGEQEFILMRPADACKHCHMPPRGAAREKKFAPLTRDQLDAIFKNATGISGSREGSGEESGSPISD